MAQTKTPPWLNELVAYLIPALLIAVIVGDWVFPLKPAVRYLDDHYPGNLRICVSIVSNESEKARAYFLFPRFFDQQTLVRVSVRAAREPHVQAMSHSPWWPTIMYIVVFGNLVRVIANKVSEARLERLIANTRNRSEQMAEGDPEE